MSYQSEVLADNPNGYWQLNEAAGPTVLDYSGNGLDMTAFNTPTFGVPGPVINNTAVSFDAANSEYLRVPDPTSLLQTGDIFTIELWSKKTNNPATFQILYNKDTGAGSISLQFEGDEKIRLVRRPGDNVVRTNVAIIDTDWHYFASVKNGAVSTIMYLDMIDVSDTVTDFTFVSNANDLTVAILGNLSFPFNGSLAQVAYYPSALSVARLQAHFDAATALPSTRRRYRLLSDPRQSVVLSGR